MPREATVREASRRLRARRPRPLTEALPRTPLRVVDVALFHGERSGAIRTYLDAKAAWAQRSGLIEHHVIVPGRAERHADADTSCRRCASPRRTGTGCRSAPAACAQRCATCGPT